MENYGSGNDQPNRKNDKYDNPFLHDEESSTSNETDVQIFYYSSFSKIVLSIAVVIIVLGTALLFTEMGRKETVSFKNGQF
jgi:hypothetical protein